MNESCHTYEWVMSHIWMSHVTHMNESCHTYEWVMPYTWLCHETYMKGTCHTYEWVMSHIWMRHVSRVCTRVRAFLSTTPPHMWKLTHSYLESEVKPIADRVAQYLEIISKTFDLLPGVPGFSWDSSCILLVLIVNSMGRILVRWKSFRNNLEILCHPICNWLYVESELVAHMNEETEVVANKIEIEVTAGTVCIQWTLKDQWDMNHEVVATKWNGHWSIYTCDKTHWTHV